MHSHGAQQWLVGVTMAMDGVVLAVPPDDPVERENFCREGETHMWRKTNEAAKPELSGKDMYSRQLPPQRVLPLWGGIGIGGFGLVMYHKWKKVNQAEWTKAVENGNLVAACKQARPDRQRGPWRRAARAGMVRHMVLGCDAPASSCGSGAPDAMSIAPAGQPAALPQGGCGR